MPNDNRDSSPVEKGHGRKFFSARSEALSLTPMREPAPTGYGIKRAIGDWKAIIRQRRLLGLLVIREIKAKYKDSALGVLWSLIKPITQLLIYYVAIGRFLGAERSIPSFAIFVFTGLTMWQLVAESISTSTISIINAAGIVKKVNLPREIFPIAAVGSAVFTFFTQFSILFVAALLISGISWSAFPIYATLSLANVLVWALALAFVLSATNVYLRDVQWLAEVAILIGFWASPIVYSYSMVAAHLPNWLLNLYLANPATLSVMGFQKVFWIAGTADHMADHLALRLVISMLVGLLALLIGQRIFARLQTNFAQEM